MNKAVFLDRDGTINEDVNYLTSKEDLVIFPRAKDALFKLKTLGFLNIVITNQSGIARGYLTEETLREIHEEMDRVLTADGEGLGKRLDKRLIDEYYYSPYHIDGVVPEFSKESEDRKPGIGMIEKAIMKYDIDIKESFLIGDSLVDMKSAEKAGIRKILVKSGYGTKTHNECINEGITIDYYAEDLEDASNYIEKLVNFKLI